VEVSRNLYLVFTIGRQGNLSLGNPWDEGFVLDALLRIDVRYRTPADLFYLSELSYKEIAEALKIPIGTVMSRGKEQLKSIVAK
jgi:DNA-directed RNA polymerase specialized sigma24 family protein